MLFPIILAIFPMTDQGSQTLLSQGRSVSLTAVVSLLSFMSVLGTER